MLALRSPVLPVHIWDALRLCELYFGNLGDLWTHVHLCSFAISREHHCSRRCLCSVEISWFASQLWDFCSLVAVQRWDLSAVCSSVLRSLCSSEAQHWDLSVQFAAQSWDLCSLVAEQRWDLCSLVAAQRWDLFSLVAAQRWDLSAVCSTALRFICSLQHSVEIFLQFAAQRWNLCSLVAAQRWDFSAVCSTALRSLCTLQHSVEISLQFTAQH